MTEEEQIARTFEESDEDIELKFEKNHFYVMNPDGKIIDVAKIYSFMHEDNIYQRIVAKTLKDVDERHTGLKSFS